MIHSIDAMTAKKWIDAGQAVLIDVRELAEYKEEHIETSYHLPLSQCTVTRLPKTAATKIIIHCKGGGRGGRACEALSNENPALELYNLEGGLMAWRTVGLPTIKGKVVPLMRQVQIAVGTLVVVCTILGFFVHSAFHVLAGLVGLGLLNAGITGWCGMAMILAKMPWNTSATTACRVNTISLL